MRLSIVAVFTAGLVLMVVPATASRTAGDSTSTIRLISTLAHTVKRDRPPKGKLSRGDSFSGTTILSNAVAQFGKRKGAVVGSNKYSFTVTAPPRALIKVLVKLPGGTLRVQGQSSLAKKTYTVSVIGGTGVFAGARGTSVSSELSASARLNVYRLRVP